MTTRIHSNNASTTLNGAITSVDATITVTAVASFPSITAGESTYNLTITNGIDVEIVTVTAVSGFNLTITRGAEGTAPASFADLDSVELRSTADSFDRKSDILSVIDSGNTYVDDTGVADAYEMELTYVTEYIAGMHVQFKAVNANTGASTLNISSVGITTLYKNHNVELEADDIEAGMIVDTIYDGAAFQMQNPISTVTGLGADTALSNLASVAIATALLPAVDSTTDFGSTALRWSTIWTDDLTLTANITVGGTVDGRDVAADGVLIDAIPTDFQDNTYTFNTATGTADAIVLTLDTPISALSLGQIFHFEASLTNTGGVTLNVDSTGINTVFKNHDVALDSGDIELGQSVSVMYDGGSFQMLTQLGNVSSGGGGSVTESDIQNSEYNYADATGTGDAIILTLSPAVTALVDGALFHFKSNGTNTGPVTLTVNGLTTGVGIRKQHNVALASGDIEVNQQVTVMYDSQADGYQMMSPIKNDPTPSQATQAQQEAAVSSVVYVTPAVQQYHPAGCKAFIKVDQVTVGQSYSGDYNITSITDAGVGDTTVTIANDMNSTAGTVVQVTSRMDSGYHILAGAHTVTASAFSMNSIAIINLSQWDTTFVCGCVYGDLA